MNARHAGGTQATGAYIVRQKARRNSAFQCWECIGVETESEVCVSEILFCGDIHGQCKHLLRVAEERPEATFVLLGDIEAPEPLEEWLAPIADRLWFIHGNHDTDSSESFSHVFESGLKHRNLHGRVAEINGVRVAGLGGVFRSKVWMPPEKPFYENEAHYLRICGAGNRWRAGLPLRHRSTIFPEAVHKLSSMLADVLVCHEAIGGHKNGFEEIDVLALAMGVKVVFHGHQHDRLDYERWTKATGIRAHGVGLRGITNLKGNVVVPGELDDQRMHRQRWSE